MKKKTMNRLMAVILALVMMISIFAGCDKQTAATEQEAPAQTTEGGTENSAAQQAADTSDEVEALQAKVAELQAQLDAANGATLAANTAVKEAQASIAALEAENAELQAEKLKLLLKSWQPKLAPSPSTMKASPFPSVSKLLRSC